MSIHNEVNKQKHKELSEHFGEKIVITKYGENEIAIECEDCAEVLMSFFKEDPNNI